MLLTGGGRVLSSLLAFVDNGVGRLLLTGDDSSASSLVSTDPSVRVALLLLGDGDVLHWAFADPTLPRRWRSASLLPDEGGHTGSPQGFHCDTVVVGRGSLPAAWRKVPTAYLVFPFTILAGVLGAALKMWKSRIPLWPLLM